MRYFITCSILFIFLTQFLISSYCQSQSQRHCFSLNLRSVIPTKPRPRCPPGYKEVRQRENKPRFSLSPFSFNFAINFDTIRGPSKKNIKCCKRETQSPFSPLEMAQPQTNGGRRRPTLRYIFNKLGSEINDILNTSLTYRQHDGTTWSVKPFIPFSGNITRTNPRRPRTRTRIRDFMEDAENFAQMPNPEKLQNLDNLENLETFKNSETPFIVSLRNTDGNHFCSATIIDSIHLISSASCFSSNFVGRDIILNVDPAQVQIQLDKRIDQIDGVSKHNVSHICVHNRFLNENEQFPEDSEDTQVAILTLAKPLTFFPSFFPAQVSWNFDGVESLQSGN